MLPLTIVSTEQTSLNTGVGSPLSPARSACAQSRYSVSGAPMDPVVLCLCVAGPHTALAVIFDPVTPTYQGVHLYLTVRVLRSPVVEIYRTFPCGCAVNRTQCLESLRSDRQIPRPADGRLRLMAWPFRRSHTPLYPSPIDGWAEVSLGLASLLAAVLRCLET